MTFDSHCNDFSLTLRLPFSNVCSKLLRPFICDLFSIQFSYSVNLKLQINFKERSVYFEYLFKLLKSDY